MRPVQGKTRIKRSGIHGWGVFALRDLKTGDIVERMPALCIRHDNISAKGHKNEHCFVHTHCYNPVGIHEFWVGTGTSSFFNASRKPNAEPGYVWDNGEGDWLEIIATRPIKAGEEITLDYLA